MFLDELYFSGLGKQVEIGAGTSLIKELFPEVFTSDIRKNNDLDYTIDAENMNFKNSSIRSILSINCFHHLSNPKIFFKELNRVLSKGGGCILIEPYYGIFARWFFSNLHDTEYFDIKQLDWKQDSNIMTKANQALSYIVFIRDKKKFSIEFPDLEIIHQEVVNNTFSHIFSGGLNFKQLIPNKIFFLVKWLDYITKPISSILGLHHIIVIKKKS